MTKEYTNEFPKWIREIRLFLSLKLSVKLFLLDFSIPCQICKMQLLKTIKNYLVAAIEREISKWSFRR